MKPGVTTHPSASINCSAGSFICPRADTITPSLIATSAVRGGAPVPSTSIPPLISTSSIGCSSRWDLSLFSDSSRITFGIQSSDISPGAAVSVEREPGSTGGGARPRPLVLLLSSGYQIGDQVRHVRRPESGDGVPPSRGAVAGNTRGLVAASRNVVEVVPVLARVARDRVERRVDVAHVAARDLIGEGDQS